MFGRRKNSIPSAQEALPGRAARLPVPEQHFVNAARLEPPFPDGMELGLFGLGCFWGAERKFWEAKGVYSTSVGYAGGSRRAALTKCCSGTGRRASRPGSASCAEGMLFLRRPNMV